MAPVPTTLLCLVLWSAGGAAGAENVPRPSVEIALVGANARLEATLTQTMQRPLQDLGADVSFVSMAAAEPREIAAGRPHAATVEVWIDVSARATATVYVTEGSHVFTRHLDVGKDWDAVALDLLEVVVTSSVQTVLSGRTLGVTREDFARALPPPPPARLPDTPPARSAAPRPPHPDAPSPTNPSREAAASRPPDNRSRSSAVEFSVALSYEGVLVNATHVAHGPGVRIAGQVGTLRIGLGLHAHLPYAVTSGGTTLDLAPQSLRLELGRLLTLSARSACVLSLGMGLDATYVHVTTSDPLVTPTADAWVNDPVARAALGFEHRIGAWSLGARAGLDIDLAGSRYIVKTSGSARTLWSPWRARPVLALLASAAF